MMMAFVVKSMIHYEKIKNMTKKCKKTGTNT
jgi:hypothetical protein